VRLDSTDVVFLVFHLNTFRDSLRSLQLHGSYLTSTRVHGKCRKSIVTGLTAGSSMFIQQSVNALQFWFGGQLLRSYPGEIELGAKRRADKASVGNESYTRSCLRTIRASPETSAIILIHHPNPFRDLLRSTADTFSFDSFLISFFALLFALFGLGAAMQGIADKEKAKLACIRLFRLLETGTTIDGLARGDKGGPLLKVKGCDADKDV